jgi:hypothetical protein
MSGRPHCHLAREGISKSYPGYSLVETTPVFAEAGENSSTVMVDGKVELKRNNLKREMI